MPRTSRSPPPRGSPTFPTATAAPRRRRSFPVRLAVTAAGSFADAAGARAGLASPSPATAAWRGGSKRAAPRGARNGTSRLNPTEITKNSPMKINKSRIDHATGLPRPDWAAIIAPQRFTLRQGSGVRVGGTRAAGLRGDAAMGLTATACLRRLCLRHALRNPSLAPPREAARRLASAWTLLPNSQRQPPDALRSGWPVSPKEGATIERGSTRKSRGAHLVSAPVGRRPSRPLQEVPLPATCRVPPPGRRRARATSPRRSRDRPLPSDRKNASPPAGAGQPASCSMHCRAAGARLREGDQTWTDSTRSSVP